MDRGHAGGIGTGQRSGVGLVADDRDDDGGDPPVGARVEDRLEIGAVARGHQHEARRAIERLHASTLGARPTTRLRLNEKFAMSTECPRCTRLIAGGSAEEVHLTGAGDEFADHPGRLVDRRLHGVDVLGRTRSDHADAHVERAVQLVVVDAGARARATRSNSGGTRPRTELDLGVDAVGQHPRQVLGQTHRR